MTNRPFAVGDVVEVLDSRAFVCGRARIAKVRKTFVQTEDGREWTPDKGWWIGDTQAWPFPTIQHCPDDAETA